MALAEHLGRHLELVALAGLLVLGGCASSGSRALSGAPAPAPTAHRATFVAPASTLEAYKTQVAESIRGASDQTFDGALPPILKSVVVLDITVDRAGRPARVMVRRSNGFRALEQRALDSVRRAGPFPAPSARVLAGDDSVHYLETWLFRADGRFQIRSLVKAPQPGLSGPLAARDR